MFATLTVPSVEASHNNETCQRSTVIMKGLRQASGQGAPAPFLQETRLVDRLDIAPLVDGAHRRVRAGDRPMTSTPTEVGEDADLGEPPVVASPPTQAAVAGTPGSTRRRFLAAVRAWAARGPARTRLLHHRWPLHRRPLLAAPAGLAGCDCREGHPDGQTERVDAPNPRHTRAIAPIYSLEELFDPRGGPPAGRE
jgi:hypothetical protein